MPSLTSFLCQLQIKLLNFELEVQADQIHTFFYIEQWSSLSTESFLIFLLSFVMKIIAYCIKEGHSSRFSRSAVEFSKKSPPSTLKNHSPLCMGVLRNCRENTPIQHNPLLLLLPPPKKNQLVCPLYRGVSCEKVCTSSDFQGRKSPSASHHNSRACASKSLKRSQWERGLLMEGR